MAEQMQLSDILSGKEPEQPKEEVAVPAKEEAKEASNETARRPDGTFAPKEAEPTVKAEPKAEPKPEPAKPPQQDLTEKERAFLSAAQQERNKRQELERQIAELKQQRQQPDPNAPAPKQFFDAPEEHLKTFEGNIQNFVIRTKLDTCEAIAKTRYPDFEEKARAFGEVLKQMPALQQNWLASADPAEYAYRVGKDAIDRYQWQQAGGADGMKKKLEAEFRAKWESEQKAKDDERQKAAAALPNSLSSVSGKGTTSAPTWGGPTPLDNVLKH